MREGNRSRLDTNDEMSNRAPNQNEDIKQLQEQLRQKDQIIDRLTRLLSEATSRPEEAPTLERAVHKALVIPIDQARRARGR